MHRTEFDAIVVGSGPNGLAAGITLQKAGLSVLIAEAKPTIGGGMRTQELTLPGYTHDVCSAIHPLVLLSPFFRSIPLGAYGLELITPDIAAAHPLDNGHAAILNGSVKETAERMGKDKAAYLDFMEPLVSMLPGLIPDLLGPLAMPEKPLSLAKFGLKALPSSLNTSRLFKTVEAKALWAGMAAHAMQPLENMATSAFGIMLMAAAHLNSWPVPKGGSQSIANAMVAYFRFLGGKIETGFEVNSLGQLPSSKAVLLDVTPRQLLKMAGEKLSPAYRKKLEKYRYGTGVFKIDWALDNAIPFTAEACRSAGTVHIGNTIEEIAAYERSVFRGRHIEKPFVLLAQQSIFDKSRAPEGKHTAWAYCHVPHGSLKDMTAEIENQVERFAPGFRELIREKHTMNSAQMEAYNANYIGGDINGGVQDIRQLYTRPVLSVSPYRTAAKGIYICSSSTPPGGGVHGMCGFHAAKQALKDVFKISNL
ncbi:NAD(P)/FAD-dependent oxidoreductase [Dyadobacter flavalbus]|uniref:NAD(P)/FAD-dependent oxidoreductase n=1 Tax=Dyadobacter flavalbus TaxID=2579942 RepID=A0A5M8QQ06_9BACT|nr:NAD(P)/FAD-dependent oxidoreductase [Dyadobacter flavalbus]KAA6436613.1 NAD(P)/FAD-dependent oxidoreductase [Dyadobacter flavalbus]